MTVPNLFSLFFKKIKAKTTFFYVFSKILFLLHMFLRKYRKMLGLRKILEHSQIFALILKRKNIAKVWNVEKFWNIVEFRKNQGKMFLV